MLPTIDRIRQFDDQKIIRIKKIIDDGEFMAFGGETVKDETGWSEADLYAENIYSEFNARNLK